MRLLLRKNEKYKHFGGWNLKLTFRFMATTHKRLHIDKVLYNKR
jgi:hypothetical protein